MPELALQDFAEVASDWFWETDENHIFVYISERFEEVTGMPRSDFIGRNRRDMALEKQDDPGWQMHVLDLDNRRVFRNLIYMGKNPVTGTFYWIRSSGRPRYDEAGEFLGFYGVASDITTEMEMRRTIAEANERLEEQNRELRAAKTRIEHHANHDALTGLANRRRLDELFDDLTAKRKEIALLHIDLDRFKPINDTLGHAAGDAVLRQVGRILNEVASDAEYVARIGGDEFVMLTETPGRAARLSRAILDGLSESMTVSGCEVTVGASIGYVEAQSGDWCGADLLHKADVALYEAKRQGRNLAIAYSVELDAKTQDSMRLEDEIVAAVDENAFFPVFQPQFDAASGRIVGVEALARWRHPARGVLEPSVFLPIADKLNIVGEIDRLILEQAVEAGRELKARFADAPRISVNVSRQRLTDPRLLVDLDRLAPSRGVDLSFEFHESIANERSDQCIAKMLGDLRERNVEFELDDFGCGPASLHALMQLQPSRLKICQQLVLPSVRDLNQRRVIRTLVDVGRTMGMGVIGEGVETEAHMQVVSELGCATVQGYAFSLPIEFEELAAMLETERQRESGAA